MNEPLYDDTSDTRGWCPCAPGCHVVLWSYGQTGRRVPEGAPCACGAMMAHWVLCEKCGRDHLVMVPVEKAAGGKQ